MSQPQSPIFQLPAELRNKVYEYLFKDPNKIIPYTGDTSNQLKFVCRQLYHETAWLELRLNDTISIVQENSEQPYPAQQLVMFRSRAYPIGSDPHLKTVVLKQITISTSPMEHSSTSSTVSLLYPSEYIARVSEPHTALSQLADICRASPQLKVRYILPGFFLDMNRLDAALYFILQGLYYGCALRQDRDYILFWELPAFRSAGANIAAEAGKWLWFERTKSEREIEREITHHMRGHYVQSLVGEQVEEEIRNFRAKGGYQLVHGQVYEQLRLPNIKFFPTCTTFDEAEFKRLLLTSASASRTAADMLIDLVARNLVDFWVAKARKWVEEGI